MPLPKVNHTMIVSDNIQESLPFLHESSCSTFDGESSSLMLEFSPVCSVGSPSAKRCTITEMQQSLCMLQESTSSLDFPPSLPSRSGNHDSSTCNLSTRSGIKGNNNCTSSIVQMTLPGSPVKQRASFTFSRTVSDLPRAGTSRRRSSSSTQVNHPELARRRKNATCKPLFPSESC